MSRGSIAQAAMANAASVLASAYPTVQDAIDSLSAQGGGTVWIDGAFTVTETVEIPDGVYLVGLGPHRSSISRTGVWSGPLIDISGTESGSDNHVRRSGLYDLTVNNDDQDLTLLRAYYANTLRFRNVEFTGSGAADAIDLVEVTDSSFISCRFTNLAQGTTAGIAVIHIRNSAASSPAFGFGSDSSNQIRFIDCTWETFQGYALLVEAGTDNTDNPSQIWLKHCKMETLEARHPMISMDTFVQVVFVDDLYIYIDDLDAGAADLTCVIEDLGGSGTRAYRNVWVGLGTNGITDCIIRVADNNPHVYENVFHWTGTYNTALIIAASGNPIILAKNIWPASGTAFLSGTARFSEGEMLQVSGAGKVTATDADWPLFSLPMPGVSKLLVKNTSDGTYRLFVRTETTTWKGVQLTL